MSLLAEARSQLEAEVASYVRVAQQPYNPILPPIDDSLLSLGLPLTKRPAASTAAGKTATGGSNKGDSATTAISASPARVGNEKQARAKLQEMIKKLHRAAFITVQVSKDESGGADGGGDSFLAHRGPRTDGGMSRQPSVLSFSLTHKSSFTNFPALPASATRATSICNSNSNSKSAGKTRKSASKTIAAAPSAVAAAAAAGSPNAAAVATGKHADARATSPHTQPPTASPSLTDSRLSQSFQRRHRDTTRSPSTATTSAIGRDRGGSPGGGGGAAGVNGTASSANALRRLEASLLFTKDCLRYAATFAEAGLTQEAQTCFLQLIAQDITNLYEPIVARCVERRPQSATRQQQQPQKGAATEAQSARQRRIGKGKALKDGQQKQSLLSPDSAELSIQLGAPLISAPMKDALIAATAAAADDSFANAGVGSNAVRVTDSIDVFSPDVPLPLALQVYKCVLRYRALVTYIRFYDQLHSDPFGDAAAAASSAAACACVEELVAHQQRVLHTGAFSAASVIHHEETLIKEDVGHTAAEKPVDAIVVAGGCALVDLLAEPTPVKPNVTSLAPASMSGDAPALLYPVEEVAAPVLFTMRLYVARMCEHLLAYLRSTAANAETAQACGEVRNSVTQRCLDALRASVSMSELHGDKAAGATIAADRRTSQQQRSPPLQLYQKTCLPLASVEYLPWRLQEYALLQHGYLQLEETGPAAAVAAAEHALQQVLQLLELEYLDSAPPPSATMRALDAAVQQCAGWLFVATWRAAIAHGGSVSANPYLSLCSASPAVSTTQPPTSPRAAAGGGGALDAASAGGPLNVVVDADEGGENSGDVAATALHMATTARTAMTAIATAVQQAVAFLVTSQWGATSAGNSAANAVGDGGLRRGSRKGTSNATTALSGVGSGNSSGFGGGEGGIPPIMNGTRLLVVLWACLAQVQQQCTLLAGRPTVAEALAAAAKDIDYAEAAAEGLDRDDDALNGQSSDSTPPPCADTQQQQQQQSSSASKSFVPRKANTKAKATAAADSPLPGAGDVGAGQAGGTAGSSSAATVELRHAHPAVAHLAAHFPRMALDLLLHLVGVVEAAGAVPQAPPYRGPAASKRRSISEGLSGRKLNETPERRSARGGRRRASSVTISGDSLNASLTHYGAAAAGGNSGLSGAAVAAASAVKVRALQSVYRSCVEALEVLLHAAAVKDTATVATAAGAAAADPIKTLSVKGGGDPAAILLRASLISTAAAAMNSQQQTIGPLSTLTRAAVWNDAVEVLGYCDETETEDDVFASRNNGGATSGGAPGDHDGPHARHYHSSTAASAANNAAVCFLYHPADTRCIQRWISWEALFQAPEGDVANAESTAGQLCTSTSLVEASAVRAVTALCTLAFASPRLVVAVRVGLAMELWWRAQLTAPAKKVASKPTANNNTITTSGAILTTALDSTNKGPTAVASTAAAASSTAVECALRCGQLLRALLLAVMLHQSSLTSALALKKGSPLTSVLRQFEDAACALDVLVPAPQPLRSPAAAAATMVGAAIATGENGQPGEQRPASPLPPLSAPSPAPSPAATHVEAVDEFTPLAAQAQASLQLSMYQRRAVRDANGHTAVPLREFYEQDEVSDAAAFANDGCGWSAVTATAPNSMRLYRVAAALVEKVTAALCPSTDETSKSGTYNNNSRRPSFTPLSPSCAARLLQPIHTDAGSLFLRCGESLRAQWQQQRTRRLLLQQSRDTETAIDANTTMAAARDPSLSPDEEQEQEAREESHYATIMWCVLSFLWRSSSSSSTGCGGAPQLDERGVAAVMRRVSAGFLQLLPSEDTSSRASRLAPMQLTRLLAHGTTVRRLLELARRHLQEHVESLLRHGGATVTGDSSSSGSQARTFHHHKPPTPTSTPATAAQQASQRRALVAARDGLTELTYTWVMVRWHLARLQVHHADYAARHVDLETLQQRHDQQLIYGRPTAKELRILQALEQDAPLLPTTAKDEEVRLMRWVKDQQHAAANTALATSFQLLEALVCAALVPLNTADPSAQQRFVDGAVRALTDAERNNISINSSSNVSKSSDGGTALATQPPQSLRHAPHTREPFVMYTPVLLWCYLAEACSRCGTAEQTALVRGVLDRHLLMESPEIEKANGSDPVWVTAPFVQKLLLQPRRAVLEDCSATARIAVCRALSALASRGNTAAAALSSASALRSLQDAYRLLLALQIQQMSDPPLVTDRKKGEAASAFTAPGLGDSTPRHALSSRHTLASAQQLLAAVTEYLTRSADVATSHGGSAAAALLLPLLVELCSVLLRLPSSSPQWADAEIQLLALRVLALFKQQQLALLTASPSSLTIGANMSAGAAATTAAIMMDAFLQLLWVTFSHVWNGVFCHPNPRQRRCMAASTSATQWARRVFDQHRRWMMRTSTEQDNDTDSAGDGMGDSSAASRRSHSARKGNNNNSNGHPAKADGAAGDGAAATTSEAAAADLPENPLSFAGVNYLPEREDGSGGSGNGTNGSHCDEERGGAAVPNAIVATATVSAGESPERHRTPRPRTGGSNSRGGATSLPTVLLHVRMPCEYVELLEDILFHLPSLWSYTLSPPEAVFVPAVSAALSRAANDTPSSVSNAKDVGRSPSPQAAGSGPASATTPVDDGTPRMQTQYDFLCYAAVQAAQALRESQRSANAASGAAATTTTTANASALGERRASTNAAGTTGGLLYGLPPIYMDVVTALQQYGAAMSNNSNNSAAAGASSAQQQSANNASGAAAPTAAAAAAAASGSRGGGNANARSVNGCVVASAACLALLDALLRYKEDPGFTKLATHVVREMLALCSDDCQSVFAVSCGAAAGAAAAGAGIGSASANTTRKKNPAGGGSGGGGNADGSRCGAGVSAVAVTTDVQHVIRTVREQAQANQRAIRAFLTSVDAETEAWLTRGGFSLAGQVQQHQQQQEAQASSSSPAAPAADTGAGTGAGSKAKAKAKAATAASKKANNKKRSKKVTAGKAVNDDDADEEGEGYSASRREGRLSTNVSYTKAARVFSFVEEQKLKQLTCGVARWRRHRAGRLLRQRFVQFNTPFLAQLHLIEAALLRMGAAAQRNVAKQQRVLQELLALTDGVADGQVRVVGGEGGRGGGTLLPSSLRASARDKKRADAAPSPTNSHDDADTEGLAEITEGLLRHCVCASNLFQHLWLPARAAAAVQLAVSHLQHVATLSTTSAATATAVAVATSSSSPLPSSSSCVAGLVAQLVTVPLFALAAVQKGYCDARRDVHNCVLQPGVVKVGADVSWSRRDAFICTVPSLLTLASDAGQRGEQAMARLAGVQARRQRCYELLQLSWCVDAETETRAEAVRDELQEWVHILQQAQQQLTPVSNQAKSLQVGLVSAAELLTPAPEKRNRATNLVGSPPRKRGGEAGQPVGGGIAAAGGQSCEAFHAGGATATDSLAYFPFDGFEGNGLTPTQAGGHGGSGYAGGDEGPAALAPTAASVEAACYGQDMAESYLIDQLLALARTLEGVDARTCAAAYRIAQQLTGGRYATELLPCLMRVEEAEEAAGSSRVSVAGERGEASDATQQAYEKALRSVSDGVWLLRAARSMRRQWSATRTSASVTGAVSWKALVEAYQRAAQALRSAGLLQRLGECLYELGTLYNAAARRQDAERNWMDALDCFLSTPHVFEDWHAQRAVPPSSPAPAAGGRCRGIEELMWIAAALTSLAEHAYATDTARATDAQLLCTLLVHQYWRLPAVVEGCRSSNSNVKASFVSSSSSWHGATLPAAEYCQLDVATLSIATSGSGGKTAAATAMPDAAASVVQALTNAAHLLVQSHLSSEAAVLAAFSDFVATRHLRQVKLTVAARLVRAIAAADLGSFSVAMRHVHSVCVGAGLPQPLCGVFEVDNLPGYYSIASAAALTTAAEARGAVSQAALATPAGPKKPGAGSSSGGGVGGAASAGAGSAFPAASTAGAAAAGAAAAGSGGKDGSGAVAPSAAATVLPVSVATLFYLYRDHETPSSPHNTAAVRAFVVACLPGLAIDTGLSANSSSSSSSSLISRATAAALPLVGGLLASAELESCYGVCLLRRLCLTVAEVLVRLGTCDPGYLFRSVPSSTSTASTAVSLGASVSTTPVASSGNRRRSSASVLPSSSNGNLPLSLLVPSSAGFPALATGERPTNACTEACRYAQVLLHSLCSADPRFALIGQPSPWSASAAATEETDGVAASRAGRTPAEPTSGGRPTHPTISSGNGGGAGRGGPNSTDAAATSASMSAQGLAGDDDNDHDGAAQSVESVEWLHTLGAIRQWAVLLTGEILAAQGQYSVCLQLMTAAITEYNDGQSERPPSTHALATAAAEARVGATRGKRLHTARPTSARVESLRGYGLEGNHRGCAALPFNFTCVYWMRVWQLMCRCYSSLRQYAQLESAAGTQGLHLCDAFGDRCTHRSVFKLYHFYALTQMGRLREAAAVVADLQHLVPFTESETADAVVSTEDGSAAAALQWWQTEHPSADESGWSSLAGLQRAVTQLLRVAVACRGVLPWRALSPAQTAVVLASPNAHAVMPLCPLSGCAKTRDLWRLHHAVNHLAFELQWASASQQPLSRTQEKRKCKGSNGVVDARASVRGSPHPPPPGSTKTVLHAANNSSARSTPSPAATATTASPDAGAAAVLLLREAQEAICPQYTTHAHPTQWLESRLLLTRLRARAVCDTFRARQQQPDDNSDEDTTVGFALDCNASTASVAAETSHVMLVLSSREVALQALPAAVRGVCEELLGTLQLLVRLPVQRHAWLRVLLLDLAAVLAAYIRDVRTTQQRRDANQGPRAAAAEEELLLPQFEVIVAACTLLAGLVADMERRVRTGADSLRGYFTDPRLSSVEACDTAAKLLQAQWPESLCTAVQQTNDSIGKLQIAPAKASSTPVEVISHPFYASPAVQQQRFGAAAPSLSSGAATAGGDPVSAGSPLLSVPTLALTFATLSDEAAAAQALTPVSAALEHDVALQLLTAHLQSLSPPINCTYLCYRDDVRQRLLEAVAVGLSQQQQQVQQQQQQKGGGQRRASGVATKRSGGLAGTPQAELATSAGSITLSFTEADVWKALVPPVLLSAVPAELFSAVGPDTLGAPLYNSVAAAALGVPGHQRSSSASTFAKKKLGAPTSDEAAGTGGRKFRAAAAWQLFLAVSPLHDAGVVEAPVLTSSPSVAPASLTAASSPSSTEAVALLPPAHLVAAVNGNSNSGGGADGAAGGAQRASGGGSSNSNASANGGNAASTGAASRGRGGARPSAVNNTSALAPSAHRSSSGGQESALMSGGAGCAWPPLHASLTACLVPSTNWVFLEQIQLEGQSLPPPRLDDGTAATTTAAPTVKPTSSAAVAVSRQRPIARLTHGSSGGAPPSVSPSAAAAAAAAAATATTMAHAAQQVNLETSAAVVDGAATATDADKRPAPLRWSCVSLELSDSTMQTLRRHLRAVLRCLHQVKEEDWKTEPADPLTNTAPTSVEVAKTEGDGRRGEAATRNALAAAVSRAQQTLRSHLAAGAANSNSNAAGGSGASAGVNVGGASSSSSFAPTVSAMAAGGPTSAVSAAGGTNAPANLITGGGGGASTATAAANALSSTLRKPSPRLNGLGGGTAHRVSGGNADAAPPAANGAGESGATYDDLAEAVRSRQMAEQQRQRQQRVEELEETKRSLLRELLEAIVSAAAGTGTAAAVMDEARVESDVQRLLPRCALTPTIIEFLCDWLGGVSVATAEGGGDDEAEAGATTADSLGRAASSFGSGNGGYGGYSSLRFYNVGLHEWMQRVAVYVAEQQQQQQTSLISPML